MYALRQHSDLERPRRDSAQRGGHPELIVIAASGIETDHQRRAADPLGEVIDVIGQVIAAGFLARLDQNDATRMRYSLLLQRQQGTERPEHRVPVIGTAAAVELLAFETRDPGAVPLGPTHHLRLLVEM